MNTCGHSYGDIMHVLINFKLLLYRRWSSTHITEKFEFFSNRRKWQIQHVWSNCLSTSWLAAEAVQLLWAINFPAFQIIFHLASVWLDSILQRDKNDLTCCVGCGLTSDLWYVRSLVMHMFYITFSKTINKNMNISVTLDFTQNKKTPSEH